jgi:iron complex outermembrane recepter protein
MKVFNSTTGSRASAFGGASVAALSIALFATTFSGAAFAQEAPAVDEGDEIIVTGFRASIESSIEARRSSDFIADFISAEDIAGLPDVSIAESLARLPGVSSQRTGGQASAINIRGLNQDLVSATLNGREQVSTSGNRTIEFDQYPSELISQAAVFKSPKASQIEGGVAGKVELRTARPLSNKDSFTATVNLRGSYNDRAKQNPDVSEYGYRASASIQGKLANDTLGFALGYSRLFQPNVATRFVQFDFTPAGQNGAPVADLDGNGIPERRGFGFEGIQFGGRETRDGVIGVVQYEPDPRFRVLIDGYYSRFKSDVRRRGLRVFNPQSGNNIITNPVIVNNALTGGIFTNNGGGVGTELVNQDESRRDELYTLGGKIEYDFSDNFTGGIDVSYSRGKSFFNNSGVNLQPFTQTAGGLVRTDQIPGLISVNYQLNGLNLPTINSISTNFTDPTAFRFGGLFIVPQADVDELFAVASDFKVTIDGKFIKSFEFGGRYAQRDARRKITSFRTFGPDGGPLALLASDFKVAGFNGGFANAGLPDFIVADIDALLDRGVGTTRIADQSFGFTRDQSFTIAEDVYSGYAQLNFDTIAGSLPFTGNIGLRVVRTEQGSTPQGTGGAGVFRGRKYTDFLPSANLSLQIADSDYLRLSVSRQISRPRFFELRGSIDASARSGITSGSGGNPDLLPYRANQFDFAYEHYFGRSGVFTVGAFYKDLRSFIIGGTIDPFDFGAEGVRIQPPPLDDPNQTIPTTGRFSAPVNGSGGFVYGFEINFAKTFIELPAPFDGLGVSVNYSYNQSDLNFTSSRSGLPVDLALPGLSKHVFNPTIFYEKSGFSIRGSGRYRSSFVAPQIGLDEQIVTNASEFVIDAQVSYTFQEGSALNGLKLLIQGTNLTDEPTRSFFGARAQTGTIQKFGRSVFVGASVKF